MIRPLNTHVLRLVLGLVVALTLATGATVATTPVGVASSTAAAVATADAPVLAADPASNLVDGQVVAVTGRGFDPGSTTTVYQCRAGLAGFAQCDWGTATTVPVDGDGAISVQLQVFAVIHDQDGSVDCRAGGCVLAADVGFDGTVASAVAPLAFDPGGPLLPPPTVTVSPATGLVDRQVVTVEGRGFVHEESWVPVEQDEAPVRLFLCGPNGEWGPLGACPPGPVQTVDVADDGSFRTEVPVSALVVGSYGEQFDCRTAEPACTLIASAGWRPDWPVAAAAELRFDAGAAIPEWPGPELVVSPDSGLHDFNELIVRGRHFTPGGEVEVALCRASETPGGEPSGCDYSSLENPVADAAGEVEVDTHGWASFRMLGGSVDCRAAPGCVVQAVDVTRGEAATVPLAFGPPDAPRGRYLDPVFSEVQVDRDVVYRETVDARGRPIQLKLDIFRPVGDTATSRPAVVWMHGGFFVAGDKSLMHPDATEAARRGYVGVSLQYRLRPWASSRHDMYLASLDAYDDAVAGVEWLRAHATDYGIDPDAVVAGGFSAGAVTAFNLAYLPGQRGPATSPVAAVAPRNGLVYTVPEPGEPPSLAFQGTQDTVTPHANVAGMCDRARPADVTCEVVTYDGRGHGQTGDATIIRRSFDFFAEQALTPRGYFEVTADAGGPYTVDEGSTVTLDATGSVGDGLGFAWSPGDRLDDPAAARPTLTGRDDGTGTLTLTVTSSHGITDDSPAAVTTRNVAPSVGSLAATVSDGRTVSLTGRVTDPGLGDTHSARVDWGDGTVTPADLGQGAGEATLQASHVYNRPGGYEVTVTVTDDDGGSASGVQAVAVGCSVTGTPGDDVLIGTRGDDVVCGLGGNDVLRGRTGDDRLHGGPGDDRLHGGRGDDVLVGDTGRDRAHGGTGRDTCDAETRRSCDHRTGGRGETGPDHRHQSLGPRGGPTISAS